MKKFKVDFDKIKFCIVYNNRYPLILIAFSKKYDYNSPKLKHKKSIKLFR